MDVWLGTRGVSEGEDLCEGYIDFKDCLCYGDEMDQKR